jgi:hypothetical protein
MGGMHGFGPVVRKRDEPVFHAEWERRTFALALAMMGNRAFNVDEYRRTIERMPPAQYLAASYYEKWLYALERVLIEKGVVARHEIDVVMAALRACAASKTGHVCTPRELTAKAGNETEEAGSAIDGVQRETVKTGSATEAHGGIQEASRATDTGTVETGVADSPADAVASSEASGGTATAGLSAALGGGARSLRFDQSYRPRFKDGDRVTARNLNPERHTRIPRYVRGHHGVIHRDWGVFIYPDTHAHGEGTKPQHCYAVEFDARETWGGDHPAGERIYVDLWEDYLDPYLHVASAADAKSRSGGGRKRLAKSASDEHGAKPARIRAVKNIAPKPPDA